MISKATVRGASALILLWSVALACATDPSPLPQEPVQPAAGPIQCADPIIQNDSGEPLNDKDRKMIEDAKKQCAVRYSRSPCVVKFIKFTTGGYGVICGEGK